MNRTLFITLAVTAGVLFNTAEAAGKRKKDKNTTTEKAKVELLTASDSLSYAAGMVRTDGLLPYIQQSLDLDTAYMADFIKGFEDAMSAGFSERRKAYQAGEQIAQMVSTRLLPILKDEFALWPDSINETLLVKGFVNALKNDMTVMPDSVARPYFEGAYQSAATLRVKAMKKAGEDYLAANATKEGVKVLPSGLQYKVLTEGHGAVAEMSDNVTVKYEGRLIDGTVFDSSYSQPDSTATFRPNQVIKGWTEALMMMPEGSKWELYIPYDLAYGERQVSVIKPYSALVFTVEVVSVSKAGTDNAKPAATVSNANKGTATKAQLTPKKVLKAKR